MDFTWNETLGMILAGAVVILLAFFLFRIITSLDEKNEVAKATLSRLEVAISEADSGYPGEVYLQFPVESLSFFLVYFGDGRIVSKWEDESQEVIIPSQSWAPNAQDTKQRAIYNFITSKQGTSLVCICYGQTGTSLAAQETTCNYCLDVKAPVEMINIPGGKAIALSSQYNIKINYDKLEKKYVIEKK